MPLESLFAKTEADERVECLEAKLRTERLRRRKAEARVAILNRRLRASRGLTQCMAAGDDVHAVQHPFL